MWIELLSQTTCLFLCFDLLYELQVWMRGYKYKLIIITSQIFVGNTSCLFLLAASSWVFGPASKKEKIRVYFENAEKWRTATGLRHLQIHRRDMYIHITAQNSPMRHRRTCTSYAHCCNMPNPYHTSSATRRCNPWHPPHQDSRPHICISDTNKCNRTQLRSNIKQSCVLLRYRRWTQHTNCNIYYYSLHYIIRFYYYYIEFDQDLLVYLICISHTFNRNNFLSAAVAAALSSLSLFPARRDLL